MQTNESPAAAGQKGEPPVAPSELYDVLEEQQKATETVLFLLACQLPDLDRFIKALTNTRDIAEDHYRDRSVAARDAYMRVMDQALTSLKAVQEGRSKRRRTWL